MRNFDFLRVHHVLNKTIISKFRSGSLKRTRPDRPAVLLFFILLLILISPLNAAAKPVKVAILPFHIHAENDLSFLKTGIMDMLSSRLSWKDKVVVADKALVENTARSIDGFTGQSLALLVGGKLGTDYVLFGSLTVFGESVSIDAKMVDVSGKTPVFTFFNQTQGMGEGIPKINQFATDINEKVFGRATRVIQPAAAQNASPRQQPRQDDIYQHPEKLLGRADFDNNMQRGFDRGDPYGPPTGKFSVVRSRKFKTEIRGIATGDVDGDGRKETVLISKGTVFIYKMTGSRFAKLAEIERKGNFLGVDTADVNNNGIDEIFVTSFSNTGKMLMSFVLEWDGTAYTVVSERNRVFYRSFQTPDRGDIIIGQKQGSKKLFAPGIYEIQWDQGRYKLADRFVAPSNQSVFGISSGDIFNNGQALLAAYSGGNLLVTTKGGEEEWKSSDRYGGTLVSMELPARDDPKGTDLYYLRARIQVVDVDGDGKNEVIAIKNKDSTGSVFVRLRMYKHGSVECLAWDKFGLYPKWRSRNISKLISDFVVDDIDNDGNVEIAYVVVSSIGTGITKGSSFIVTQNIND